jgi:hypothetical protein
MKDGNQGDSNLKIQVEFGFFETTSRKEPGRRIGPEMPIQVSDHGIPDPFQFLDRLANYADILPVGQDTAALEKPSQWLLIGWGEIPTSIFQQLLDVKNTLVDLMAHLQQLSGQPGNHSHAPVSSGSQVSGRDTQNSVVVHVESDLNFRLRARPVQTFQVELPQKSPSTGRSALFLKNANTDAVLIIGSDGKNLFVCVRDRGVVRNHGDKFPRGGL